MFNLGKHSSVNASSKKKLASSKSGLRVVPTNNTQRSPFELREPFWCSDKESVVCSAVECRQAFDTLRRRHHCRRCGRIFCHHCCRQRVPLSRMCFVDPVRHCAPCAAVSSGEELFFGRQLKLLVQGAEFYVASENGECPKGGGDSSPTTPPSAAPPSVDSLFTVCLSADYRHIVFQSASGSRPPSPPLEPVCLERVDNVAVTYSSTQYNGELLAERAVVRYRAWEAPPVSATSSSSSTVCLTADPGVANWRQSAGWINTLQQAMVYVYESREPPTASLPPSPQL